MDRDRFDDWDDAEADAARIEETTAGDGVSESIGALGGTRRGIGRTLPRALPNALGAALLVGAIALGATAVGPIVLTAGTAPATCENEQGFEIPCPTPTPTDGQGGDTAPTATPTDGSGAEPPKEPDPTPTDKPKEPKPTDRPKEPKPTDKPNPTDRPDPKPESLGLRLSNVENGVKVDWTTCRSARFDVYKIVRSTDERVRWPLGDNDKLVAATTHRAKTVIVDGNAPSAQRIWYRVFCLDKTAHGYKVLNSSPARAIKTNYEDPAPKPVKLGFDVNVTGDGVVLHWEACTSDGFHYYKVVRSHGENPSYLPWTDGSQLIGVIENSGTTSFTDTHVESGQTWFYRVQSIGYWHGKRIVLGQTAAIEVTIP
jgi:hypothetical protein